jgi:hypothetical protein
MTLGRVSGRRQSLRHARVVPAAMHAKRSAKSVRSQLRPAAQPGRDDEIDFRRSAGSGARDRFERLECERAARRRLRQRADQRRADDERRIVARRDAKRLLAERRVEHVAPREHLADALQQVAERRRQSLRALGELQAAVARDEQRVVDELAHPAQREVRDRLAGGDEIRDAMELAGAQERLDGLDEPRVEDFREIGESQLHRTN